MIREDLADGKLVDNWDIMRFQLIPRSDPTEHEELSSLESAAADDDLTPRLDVDIACGFSGWPDENPAYRGTILI